MEHKLLRVCVCVGESACDCVQHSRLSVCVDVCSCRYIIVNDSLYERKARFHVWFIQHHHHNH